MAKRKRAPTINVGQCVVMRPGQMMSYARSDAGKVVAKVSNMLHVKYYGDTKPKIFNESIFTAAPCPAWLAGARQRKRGRR